MKLKDHYMQICGKKKPNDDSDDAKSDDEESYTKNQRPLIVLAGTSFESQVRTVTPKPMDTDSIITVSDIISVA